MDFANELQARVVRANDALRRFIAPQPFQNTPLVEAMQYGALLGGKRLRPALVLLSAILLGIALPITPVQILWVNMVSAITLSLPLAFEKPYPALMLRPPRSRTRKKWSVMRS